mmetsp:Transcript_123889/g.201353  ORF Transcript_123889/g.201353 Transcript_123889/m.201353 type:complete len:104 (+) Transcript_123889:283-594(+)
MNLSRAKAQVSHQSYQRISQTLDCTDDTVKRTSGQIYSLIRKSWCSSGNFFVATSPVGQVNSKMTNVCPSEFSMPITLPGHQVVKELLKTSTDTPTAYLLQAL